MIGTIVVDWMLFGIMDGEGSQGGCMVVMWLRMMDGIGHKIGPKNGSKNREKWPGGMGVLQKDFFGHTETRLDFCCFFTFFRRVAENEGLV